jgi:hypothetical protein
VAAVRRHGLIPTPDPEVPAMSIIRVGLAETKNFSEGYDMIFGKKEDKEQAKKSEQDSQSKQAEQAQEKK